MMGWRMRQGDERVRREQRRGSRCRIAFAGAGGAGIGLGCIVAVWGASGCGSRSGLDGFAEPEPREFGAVPARVTPVPPAPIEVFPVTAPEAAPRQAGCVDVTRSYVSFPPTVMLLIDQSQSMTERFGQSTRWDVLRDAIVDPENGLLAWLDASSSIGLMLYSSVNGFAEGGQCPLLEQVDIALGNADAIRAAYLAQAPRFRGDTPTGDSIDQAVVALNAVSGTVKYILLLTDGQPDTCAEPNPQNGLDEAILAAQNAYAQGIRVYTVGVSEEIARGSLQAMANAGVGKDPGLIFGRDGGAAEPLSASTEPRALAEQLKGIIGDVRSCTVELGEDVGPTRAFDGTLELDGTLLRFGDIDGWTFVDADTLKIHGTACDRILGQGERLQVHFPCVEPFSPPR